MGIRVGVVDDELFFREAISEVLEAAGFDCVTAEDGAQAITLADDPGIGVLVLDIRMPGMDGIDVLRHLREQRPGLRVLVLSGASDQETVLEALRLGACDYLAKPLHDEELVLAVGRACESYALAADAEQLRARLAQVVTVTEDLSRNASRAGSERRDYLRSAAVDAAAELLQARRTSLLLRDELDDLGDVAELQVVASVGCPRSIAELDVTIVGQGIAGQVAQSGDAVLVESRAQAGRFLGDRPAGRYQSESFVIVPLFRRQPSILPGFEEEDDDEVMGVMCATDPEGRESFGVDDLALLRLLAGRVAELLDHPQRKGLDLETGPSPLESRTPPLDGSPIHDRDAELVGSICDALVNEVEPDSVFQAVLEPIERELSAVPVSLYLVDRASGDLVCEAQRDGGSRADRKVLPSNQGLTGTVLQAGSLVASQSPELDSRYDRDVDTPEDGTPGPLLCLPIRLRGRVVGVCRAFLPGNASASPRTGEVVAAALSAAVRNVLLYRSLVESIEEVAEARREARS
ncbi:MAG: response regulator [Myxococcota bacterium]